MATRELFTGADLAVEILSPEDDPRPCVVPGHDDGVPHGVRRRTEGRWLR